MDEDTFERLYWQARRRDDVLLREATALARGLAPLSAMQAVRLARALLAAGEPFFLTCDRIHRERAEVLVCRAHRDGRLTDADLQFCKDLIRKAKTSW